MATSSSGTNWLDVLSSALWPIFALIVLIVLAGPIVSLADRVSRDTGAAQEIEIGPIRLRFSEADAHKLSPPSKEIADALVQLTPEDIDRLLSHGERSGYGVCTVSGAKVTSWTGPVDQARSYLRFSELGLVEFDTLPASMSVRDCAPGEERLAQLTEFGKTVRRYLLEILSSTVRISKNQESSKP